jgi:hypothetical protein
VEAVIGVWIRRDERIFNELFDCDTFYIGCGSCLGGAEDCQRGPGGGSQGINPQEDSSGPGRVGRLVVP